MILPHNKTILFILLKRYKLQKKLKCKCFINAGSQSEYGIIDEIITEETVCNPISEYGKAKLEFYIQGKNIAKDNNIKFIHLRIFSIYGVEHKWTVTYTSLMKLLSNEDIELTSCEQTWNFLFVNDAAEQIIRIADYSSKSKKYISEVYNICSEDTRPLKSFISEMKEITNSRSNLSFGAIKSKKSGSLNPSANKVKATINFINNFSFREGILASINHLIVKKCILCGESIPQKPLLTLDNAPVEILNMPTKETLYLDYGKQLKLFQCKYCSLVQFDCSPPSYYKNVIRSAYNSESMINLHRILFREFINKFNLPGKKIVEIGCGQGECLTTLTEFNVIAKGIENSEESVMKANSAGLSVYKLFLNNANDIIPDGPYDGFFQFNFLEHQPNPSEMVRAIYNNLTEDGVGLVTVPSFESVFAEGAYYQLCQDHLAYYSEDSLKFLFQKNGFEIIESKMVHRDMQSILVKKRRQIDISILNSHFNDFRNELIEYVRKIKLQDKKIAFWGAGHEGLTVISTLNISSDISYIIDTSPLKQGKYAPVSHLLIVPPEYFNSNPVDVIIIGAPVYTQEISRSIRSLFGNEIEIIAIHPNHIELLK